MDYILDISTDIFERIKNHETTILPLSKEECPKELKAGDGIKLYHPGNQDEALRVVVKGLMQEDAPGCSVQVEIELAEWMFRMETELDDLLREEKKWMEEM